jgi:hypothetical protein
LKLLSHYPIVAKQLRDHYKNENSKDSCNNNACGHKEPSPTSNSLHMCGFHTFNNGLGYADLEDLMKNPKNLDFIFGKQKL